MSRSRSRAGLTGLVGRRDPRQDANADQTSALRDPDAIEKLLVGACLNERALEPRGKLGLFRQRAEKARIDDRIHHIGKLGKGICQPWRATQHERDEGGQIGILPQQREQPPPAVQCCKEPVEGDDRLIGIRRAGEMLQ